MAQLYIKIAKSSISFSLDNNTWKNYAMKINMSVEANLREAFRDTDLLHMAYSTVSVLVDSPVVLIPLDDFIPEEAGSQYRFLHPDLSRMQVVESCVLTNSNDVALFSVSKDLKTVLGDHFDNYHLQPLMFHIWERLVQHSIAGHNKKLYCYFHDRQMEVCSFKRNHFCFQNSFEVTDWHDALFFILGIWQQLGCRSNDDDLFILGDIPAKEAFMNETRGYIKRLGVMD